MSFRRVIGTAVVLGLSAAFLLALLAIADIYSFEYRALAALLGWKGLFVAGLVFVALAVVWSWSFSASLGRDYHWRTPALVLVAMGAVAAVWLIDWMFLERPVSLRFVGPEKTSGEVVLPAHVTQDFEGFSIVRAITSPQGRQVAKAMYARIWLTNKEIHVANPIGSTIDKYAARYDVEPVVLFHIAYLHSFWGEATSGPVPFLRAMTSEGIRDVVQIHLPGWFVESGLRRKLISGDLLQRLAGPNVGFKLRYALHKATLDVSAQPYELNLLSDVLLVLREYPDEFRDVLGYSGADPVRSALRRSYEAIGAATLQKPYEFPYRITPFDASYYSANRKDVKKFVRAAYYASVADFDLATRMAALLVVYQRDYYRKALGEEVWAGLPDYQRAAMLGMTRDILTTGVGHLAYNVYALPEMNCTPVEFVARSAVEDPGFAEVAKEVVWRPTDFALLWGGTTTKLEVMSEVWQTFKGQAMPGIPARSSAAASLTEVLRRQ